MTLQLITVRKAEQGELGLSWHIQKSLKNNQLNSNHYTSQIFRARKDLGDHLLLFLHFTKEENKAQEEIQHQYLLSYPGQWNIRMKDRLEAIPSCPWTSPLLARMQHSVVQMPGYIILYLPKYFQINIQTFFIALYAYFTYSLISGYSFSLKDYLLNVLFKLGGGMR